MRRLALVSLLVAACTEPAPPAPERVFPDPGTADEQPAGQAECASELGKTIFESTRSMVANGTVPASLYSTSKNAADTDVLIDGPQNFPAMRTLIASAEHHVSLQTYVWEADTDPTNEILAGIRDLAARRAETAPDGPPVAVRFLFDASTLSFGSNINAMPRAWAGVEALAIDPKLVTFEIAGFYTSRSAPFTSRRLSSTAARRS